MKNDIMPIFPQAVRQSVRTPQGSGTSAVTLLQPDEPPQQMHQEHTENITVALVDGNSMSRGCIISAMHATDGDIKIVPFSSIRECITCPKNDINMIVYYCHDETTLESVTGQEVTTLRQVFGDVPVIVLSDARRATQPRMARAVIRSGARGFISTRTIELPVVPAAIRYVSKGGTVVPVDILFSENSECEEQFDHEALADLTPRQRSVLRHLRQGKPNKIIAHDLRMSESTVKVHIRNIMRKMGATNRTQAVYRARQLYTDQENA